MKKANVKLLFNVVTVAAALASTLLGKQADKIEIREAVERCMDERFGKNPKSLEN